MSLSSNLLSTAPVAALAATPAQARLRAVRLGGLDSLRRHWPEYLIEAWGLATFMVSACVFAALLDFPGSPLNRTISSPFARRALGGVAMGLTAIAIFYSPWGKRSGAHINPAVTLSFLRLGKVKPWDAFFYIASQSLGAALGVGISALLLGRVLADSAVRYAVTVPGPAGVTAAFFAEALIAAIMLTTVLEVSGSRLENYTPLFAGTLVALFITLEAPFSGMSMNPARSFGSAIVANVWTSFWVYLSAPLAGMLTAAELVARRRGRAAGCAKLHHRNSQRCIFCGANGGLA